MKEAVQSYINETAQLSKKVSYIARFIKVNQANGAETPFAVDFASHPVLGSTKTKILALKDVTGGEAQIVPEEGRATVGEMQVTLDPEGLTNGDDLIAQYLSPDAPNGDEIRTGQRVQLFCGYQDRLETEYMPCTKMIVEGVYQAQSDGMTYYVIQAHDIQRFMVRTIFTNAHITTVTLRAHPLVIALRILLSTGLGTNGPYDVLESYNGIGLPQSMVDVAAFEELIETTNTELELFLASNGIFVPFDWEGIVYTLPVTNEEDAKDFIESELFRPMNCYPVIKADGKYSINRTRNHLVVE